ncbi:MAG: lactoylglutathione lyase [Hyphomicrobiales bacterium]|nr:MAG: lactoylglutathione lyase [Hyphomicrobiales bacterium]
MNLLHLMVRVLDVEKSLKFYEIFGLKEVRRHDNEGGRFSLIFIGDGKSDFLVELTHNWDETKPYGDGKSFGHIAIGVANIMETCDRCEAEGHTILRPPRDGHMAFVKSPDGISIEVLQNGDSMEVPEKWANYENVGSW